MTFVRSGFVLSALMSLLGCGGGESKAAPASDAGSMDAGARPSDAGAEPDGGPNVEPVPTGCARFGFQVSGQSCGASCSSVGCSCPGAFPKSLADCTADGCLVAVDCAALCAAELGEALSCTDQYSVRPAERDAGAADAATLAANGERCSLAAECESGRCAALPSGGFCIAGTAGDPCTVPRDCESGLCEQQLCQSWQPVRTLQPAESVVTLSELRSFDQGYTVAGFGRQLELGALGAGSGVFVSAYGADGGVLTSARAATPSDAQNTRGARLDDGTLRMAGVFYRSWQAESTQLSPIYEGNADLFVASYAPDGGLQWARSFGARVFDSQRLEALAIDGAGASYITGAGSDIDFGAGAVGGSPFLAKVLADGSLGWARAFGSDSARGEGLAIDGRDGSLVFSGSNGGLDDLSFGDGSPALSGFGIFLAKFSPTGEHVWSKGFESFSPTARVAIAPNGDIVLAGSYRNRTSFGGETFDDLGAGDVFVARFTSAGEHVWSRSLGGGGSDRALSVAVDADGSIALGGWFSGTADLGAGPVTAVGEWDGFVALLSGGGEVRKLRYVRGPRGDEVRSVAFAPEGLWVGGLYSGTQDLGDALGSQAGSFVLLLPR